MAVAEFLLRRPWAVHDVRCPSLGAPIPVRKQLTGEPVAGELHSGFGGRGWRAPFPTPIQRTLTFLISRIENLLTSDILGVTWALMPHLRAQNTPEITVIEDRVRCLNLTPAARYAS